MPNNKTPNSYFRLNATGFLLVSAVIAACSDLARPEVESGAFADVLASGPQVFVLASIEDQRTEPLVLFDHRCDFGWRQNTLRDSITLHADGSARRGSRYERLEDGAVLVTYHFMTRGAWTSYTARNVFYYSDGPSLVLKLTPENYAGETYDMRFRVRGTDTLTTLSAMGGWCLGSDGDSRTAEFIYTRR